MARIGVFNVLLGLFCLSTRAAGQLVDADCTTLLGGSAPAEFDPAGGPVTDARLVVRTCVSDTECDTVANRAAGSIITQYRVGTKYIINFESSNIVYDLFLLSDSSSLFQRPTSYQGGAELFGTGGKCFTHTLTTDTIDFEVLARNTTDAVWDPFTAPSPTTVTFRAVARISGSDIFVERQITMEPEDCTGSDLAQNILSCEARYNGDTCIPTCTTGFELGTGTVTCTGGSLVTTGTICQNKIDPWCTETDPPGQDYSVEGCPDQTIGASCTGYCNEPSFYTEGAPLICGAGRTWIRSGTPCTYSGNCPLTAQTDREGVLTPSGSDPSPCGNLITGENCIINCGLGRTPSSIPLQCNGGGWDQLATCTPIPNLCQISSITGDRVNPGDCTDRDVSNGNTCTYQCDDDYLAFNAQLKCTGETPIGWNKQNFSCVSPLPTPAPVPTPEPTNFPLPTATVIPTAPTPPTTPTLNPFFLNKPTEAQLSDEGIYIIIGAGGGAAVLAAAACVGLSLRSTRKQYEAVIDEKGEAANHYVDERFGQVSKLKYNAFDNW